MTPKDIPSILELFATPGIALAAALWIYFMNREVRKDVANLRKFVEDMHDNGFVTKESFEDHQKVVDGRLERVEERIFN